MSKTKNCRKTCLKIDLENKSALSIFVSSNMKKNFLRRIFKTQLFLKSLGPYICVTHEILLHQSIGVTLASVEHSVQMMYLIVIVVLFKYEGETFLMKRYFLTIM